MQRLLSTQSGKELSMSKPAARRTSMSIRYMEGRANQRHMQSSQPKFLRLSERSGIWSEIVVKMSEIYENGS